jgi:hypothetical protein
MIARSLYDLDTVVVSRTHFDIGYTDLAGKVVGSNEPCAVRLLGRLQSSVARPCNLRGESHCEHIPIRSGQCVLSLRHFVPTHVIIT